MLISLSINLGVQFQTHLVTWFLLKNSFSLTMNLKVRFQNPLVEGLLFLISHRIDYMAQFQIQLGAWFLLKAFLSLNQLQSKILKSLSNLCNLQALELDSNNLIIGKLPKDLLACTNGTLWPLSSSDNRFSRSVPYLTGFLSLERLYLVYNQLNGTLPESIGQLAELVWFDIGSNSLQGTISKAHLFNLSNLAHLGLSSSSLTFNMSLEWVPPFQLGSLLLASCKLGPPFPRWLQAQKHLTEFVIFNSEISDILQD